jgi:AcrR family transcriptional regulator
MSGRNEWIAEAVSALGTGGVDAVRVEALGRRMGVTKGSFYWHFTDRPALLAAVLEQWEQAARTMMEAAARQPTAEERLIYLMRGLARVKAGVPDAEIFAWARRDRAVAERVSVVERERVVFVKQQLSEMGASLVDAHRRAEAAYLAATAWIERAGRTPWMKSDYDAFVKEVFRLLLV